MKIKTVFFLKIITLIIVLSTQSSIALKSPRICVITPITIHDEIESFLKEISTKPLFNNMELYLIGQKISLEQKAIIDRYSYFFSQIHCLCQPKSNTISALINYVLISTSAPYITLMGIDDYRCDAMLYAQENELQKNPSIDVVYGDYYISYSKNTPTEQADNWYNSDLPEYSPHLLYRDIPGHHTMWRATLHEKIGFLNDNFQFHHMWEFWNRAGKAGIQFKKIHSHLSTYYFNYFNQKKILFNEVDFNQSYAEEQLIKEQYSAMWGTKPLEEKSFVIITASYNNKDWYRWNLDSVLFQNYSNYRIIYIDDASRDKTGHLVQEYVKALNKEDKIQIIINTENIGALANLYNAIHSCKKDEIVILLDGDDAFAHDEVLNYLNTIYQDPKVWLTYGQFQWFPSNIPGFASQIPTWVIEQNSIRSFKWVTTHLRTFYAGLYQKIKKEDLLFEGQFYAKAWDLGIMYPMIEMAAWHTKFIPEILMKYNTANTINDNKVNLDLQARIDTFIRNKPKYNALMYLF